MSSHTFSIGHPSGSAVRNASIDEESVGTSVVFTADPLNVSSRQAVPTASSSYQHVGDIITVHFRVAFAADPPPELLGVVLQGGDQVISDATAEPVAHADAFDANGAHVEALQQRSPQPANDAYVFENMSSLPAGVRLITGWVCYRTARKN